MALHPNHPTVTNLRKLLRDLNESPTAGTITNIVDDFVARGGEFGGEDRELYEKMLANPNDKELEAATVDRVREILKALLAATGNPVGGRRRGTKKRKSLKKRSTRKR